MSMDIRSFFSKTNGSSPSKPKSTEKHVTPTKKRNRRVIESDDEDDDDIVILKKKQKENKHKNAPETQKKSEVVVDVESYFGSKPVLQKKQKILPSTKKDESPKKKESSKKQKKSKQKQNKSEVKEDIDLTFENDDELEASLLQTDDEQLVTGMLSSGKKESKSVESKSKDEKNNYQSNNKKTPVKETKQTPTKEESSLLNSEKKRKNAEAYQKYLQRSGPKNPGSKEIPKGTPTCLQGLTFVITGILDSLERDEATELIQKCGGRVVGQPSKKTNFMVVGEEAGASKLQKAEKFGTKKINEDELLNLIVTKSGVKESTKDLIEGTPEKKSKDFDKSKSKKRSKEDNESSHSKPKVLKSEEKKELVKSESSSAKSPKTSAVKIKEQANVPTTSQLVTGKENVRIPEESSENLLWVDKYKPKSTDKIIGQTGDKSNVKKLTKWLQNWHKNHSTGGNKKLTRPAPWAQNDDGSFFKAALLSGPPGVGKTTTIHLVCQELGLDLIEFNASDTRSKRLLQEEVTELLSTRSIRGFMQDGGNVYQKHVLLMDEVDGMAGNEDRGGIQELIQLIKNTKVPIVGICNDRNHPKMRSLVNYCFDLRFQRPRVQQIKGAMKSICVRENIDISGEALEELIVSSNQDVRQVLHSLSVLASGDKTLSTEEAKIKGQQAKKPLNLSPWDVVRKVFSASEQEKMSFMDKTDLFFQDYSLGPLFVQDTYIRVNPYKVKGCVKKKLELISNAAESLAIGDVIERTIRSQNAWSLLPVQAVFSSVMPGHYMSGHVQGQIQFPVWLGKNSKRNKFDRLLQDLQSSLRISVTGTKEAVNMDYLHHIKDGIVRPLIKDGAQGVQEALKFMLNYNLTKDDLDCIMELSSWPGVNNPFSDVDSKVKAALTRALNKEALLVSHSSKKSKIKSENEFDVEEVEEEEEEEEEEEKDAIDFDPMIKKGKPKKVTKEESTSKGKATKAETVKKGKGKKQKN